jgi:hypothetical protein
MDKKDDDVCVHGLAFFKHNYPLLQFDNSFDHLNGACYFNWMDLKSSKLLNLCHGYERGKINHEN